MDRRTSLLGGRRSTDRTQWLDDLYNDLEPQILRDTGTSDPTPIQDLSVKTGPTMDAARRQYLCNQAKQYLEQKNTPRSAKLNWDPQLEFPFDFIVLQ